MTWAMRRIQSRETTSDISIQLNIRISCPLALFIYFQNSLSILNKIMKEQKSYRQFQNSPEHTFDFKVKVNYQNGGVSLIGPNGYSPSPINFTNNHNHPITHQPNRQFTSPPKNYPIPQQFYQGNFIRYQSSMSSTPSFIESKVIKKPSQSEPVMCVICDKAFTSEDFGLHLQLHRNRQSTKNTFYSENKNNTEKSNKNFSESQPSLSSLNSKDGRIRLLNHNNQGLYSFQNIGDSTQIKNPQHWRQTSQQYLVQLQDSIHSQHPHESRRSFQSNSNQSKSREVLQFNEPILSFMSVHDNQIADSQTQQANDIKFKIEKNKQSSSCNSEKVSVNSAQINSSPNPYSGSSSQSYLKQIVQKNRLKNAQSPQKIFRHQEDPSSDKRYSQQIFSSRATGDIYQPSPMKSDLQNHYFSVNYDVQPDFAEKREKLVGSMFYRAQNDQRESINGQREKNSTVSHQNNLKKLLDSFDSDDEFENPQRSQISSILESKEPLQNLSKQQMLAYQSNSVSYYDKNFQEPQRPVRPSQRNISLAMSKVSSPGLGSSKTLQSNPRSVETMGVNSRQIFRGIQADQHQIAIDQEQMNESYGTKSSKASTKSKLPINYFAINDVLQRSRKN